ncbi:MAG: hypothetical protein ACOY3H_04210 [Bacillota bacterium]
MNHFDLSSALQEIVHDVQEGPGLYREEREKFFNSMLPVLQEKVQIAFARLLLTNELVQEWQEQYNMLLLDQLKQAAGLGVDLFLAARLLNRGELVFKDLAVASLLELERHLYEAVHWAAEVQAQYETAYLIQHASIGIIYELKEHIPELAMAPWQEVEDLRLAFAAIARETFLLSMLHSVLGEHPQPLA